jgi:protein O-mannosyl-transferase
MSGKLRKNIQLLQQVSPLAVVAFTAIIYFRALHNNFTSFDDDFYILRNPFIKDFSWHGVRAIFTSFYSSNYHPLTTLTYLLEYRYFGLNPFPYHLFNVLLHLANTWLVFHLARRLSGRRLVALIVSLLFAVHPMHVESVAWVAERKDVLYAFFFLLSLHAYLHYLDSGHRARYYALMLALFLASLCAKATAVTLPVVFILIDYYKSRTISWKLLPEKIPFLLLSVVFGVLNIMAQTAGGSINNIAASYGSVNRVFLITSAISSYLLRLVAPYHLSGMHYFPVIKNGLMPWQYYASLPLVALITWLVLRRSSWRRELIFGFSFFLVTVALMLQVVSVGSALIAERYTYISYIGLFYIIGQWIAGMNNRKWRNAAVTLFFLAIPLYAAETWYRIGIWENNTVLFNDMIEKNPEVYFGYWMRGNFEKRDGNLQLALQDYNKSISLNPAFEDAYYNRGTVYDALGNPAAAIKDYSVSIRLRPDSPDAYNNRGWAFYSSGDTAAALLDLERAISLKPAYPEAYNNRGWIYYQSGNTEAALLDFNKAISLNPLFDKPLYNRAALESNTGDFNGAINDFNKLLEIHPENNALYYYRAMVLLALHDTAGALPDLKKAQEYGNTAAMKAIDKLVHY